MMLPSPSLVIPAQAGIHLSVRKFLPIAHERRNLRGGRVLALRWIPAFAGMALLFGQVWAGA